MTKQKIGFAVGEPEKVQIEQPTPQPTHEELLEEVYNALFSMIRYNRNIKNITVKVDYTGTKKVNIENF